MLGLSWRRFGQAACIAAGLGFSGVPARAADPKAISQILDTLGKVHSFNEVTISPDGRHVIYGDTVRATRDGAVVEAAALWIADAKDGGNVRRLTACPGKVCDEHGAAWSPDGRQIAFVTEDATGQTQIAVSDGEGRLTKAVTTARGPVDTPRWSPAGDRLAFLYAEGAPKTPGPLNPLSRDAGELNETVYEQRIAIVSAGGGKITVLGPADLNIYEYDWSPDGRKFAVTAAHGSGDNNWWIAELDTVDAETGGVDMLFRPKYQMASPRWSGDGRRIAYIGGIMSDEGITGGDIFVIAAAGGDPVDVTPGLKASVQTLTWNHSTNALIATEFSAGDEVLATVDVDAKSQREIWRAPQMIWANNVFGLAPGDAGVSLSKDGTVSAVISQSYTKPPEIEVGRPGHWKSITHANAGVHPMTGPALNVSWRSDQFTVQGLLIAPATVKPGQRYPLVVDVHGGPSFAHYSIYPASPFSFDAALASLGYYVFKPNPRGSYGQGAAFEEANIRDFGGGDLRDVLAGLDHVQSLAPIDPNRMGITGWSYGGYMTMWAITQTHRFKAAVAGAGLSDMLSYYGTNNIDTWMLPFFGSSVYDDPKIYEKSSPMTYIKNVQTPTLLVAGDRDAEVPITQSYEYWNALKRLGVKTSFVVYPDEGHLFFKRADQADTMTRLVDWFDRYLNTP
jgi:dipeptidyl aminopeptidase/acylaminoacyl peptidase